jgi:hypothetical protein
LVTGRGKCAFALAGGPVRGLLRGDRVRLLVCLSILLAPALAAAEPDAHIGGGILLPTAETQPAGTAIAGTYELAIMGASYAVTDDVQLSLTALAPVADLPLIAAPTIKVRLLDQGRLHLAVIGGGSYVRDQEVGAGALQGGAAASLCLDDACGSLLSASAGLAHLFIEDEENPDGMNVTVGGVSVVQRIAPHVKVLVEGGRGAIDPESLGYLGYGVRLVGDRVAADLTLLMDGGGEAAAVFPLGVPFAAVSYSL